MLCIGWRASLRLVVACRAIRRRTATVGVVWHDEGAWVHNARNRALWGVWRTDDWNPMYIAPVFTGLEYGAFRVLRRRHVAGARWSRSSRARSRLPCCWPGVRAHRRPATPALIGGALLATNYVS